MFKEPGNLLSCYAAFDSFLAFVFLSFLVWFIFSRNRVQNFVVVNIKTDEIAFCDSRELSQDVRTVLWRLRVYELNLFREELEKEEKLQVKR